MSTDWKEWPDGIESDYELPSMNCPLCREKLIPAQMVHSESNIDGLEEYSRSEDTFLAVCLNCRSVYWRGAPQGTVSIPSELDVLIQMSERIRTLEETLSALVKEVDALKKAPPQRTHAPASTPTNDPETADFMKQFAHLL